MRVAQRPSVVNAAAHRSIRTAWSPRWTVLDTVWLPLEIRVARRSVGGHPTSVSGRLRLGDAREHPWAAARQVLILERDRPPLGSDRQGQPAADRSALPARLPTERV